MIVSRDTLLAIVANARWFSNYYVRSRELPCGMFRVKTNYPCKHILEESRG